jgi:hypothetical protein
VRRNSTSCRIVAPGKFACLVFEITEVLKGISGTTTDVLSAEYNGGGSCGVNFKVGESYLVYAEKRRPLLTAKLREEKISRRNSIGSGADKFNERLPGLETSICTRTEHMRWAQKISISFSGLSRVSYQSTRRKKNGKSFESSINSHGVNQNPIGKVSACALRRNGGYLDTLSNLAENTHLSGGLFLRSPQAKPTD